ncbi:syntenin-1-like [Tubulanus polymorphus]|uniref:syntenin-1-like n=1 Tax=Tubulanus polymorphus TaxID=672921 RepID=UPI003DA65EA8
MSLYPSLEDMKVTQMAVAQHQRENPNPAYPYPQQQQLPPPQAPGGQVVANAPLYPSLTEYMGLELQALGDATGSSVVRQTQSGQMQIAPITGNNVGLKRSEVKQGVREVIACKDAEGKIGLRVRSVNKGIFIALVHSGSPAAMAGLRFGDQILQINGETVACWTTDKTMDFLKKCDPKRITFAIRDRPFERTITMQKDSVGQIGFIFRDGCVKSIVKDSSAARNGLLTDHQLLEIQGQNVVGLKDKEIQDVFAAQGVTITITIIPRFIYDHIVKCMGSSLIKKVMDHSIPDL